MVEQSDEPSAVATAKPTKESLASLPAFGDYGLPITQVAAVFAAGGYFGPKLTKEQALTRLIMGRAMGLTEVESMTELYIFEGNVGISSQRRGKECIRVGVRWRVIRNDEEVCTLEFYERATGEIRGTSTFTMEEAKRAGLAGKNTWRAYPSDMLFARALSRGQRRFVPEAFGGLTVYDRDEIEAPPASPVTREEPETLKDRLHKRMQTGGEGPEWEEERLAAERAIQPSYILKTATMLTRHPVDGTVTEEEVDVAPVPAEDDPFADPPSDAEIAAAEAQGKLL